MTDTGVYLYAVTPEPAGPRLEELRGVLGGPVRPIARGGLVAYVSDVPLDQFGEEPLRRLLEDLDWVEGVARAHHRVVEALADDGPAAPVRLVTVYSGEDQILDLLDRRHDDFAAVLARVAGRREWGVKAYVSRAARGEGPAATTGAAQPGGPATAGTGRAGGPVPSSTGGAGPVTAAPGGGAAGGPGTAYLKRRKASLRSREDLWRAAVEQAERLHSALGGIAVASRRHRPQDPQLSGRSDLMVLNGAYLVEPGRDREFAAALGAFRAEGMDVQLTGPWAPYSFTSLELGTTGPEARDDR
ncbi:GvpL/GvpF family gas vesicle protein [Microbispora sp. NPDC049125]|uniref:GvpL/GvpF family gas vesicle protein n=1 Tax=Microbispora sp. NPDC049125 TaxID=3154929 RepID=UPI003466C9D9